MLSRHQLEVFRTRLQDSSLIAIAAVMMLAGLLPVVLQGTANAATLSNRSVTISTSQPDATGVDYGFTFTTQSSTTIQSLSFQFCTTPLGTCILPGTDGSPTAAEKIDVSQVTASSGAFTGTNATAFADYTGADAGGCTEADGGSGVATQFCATRTEALSEAAGVKTFQITGISNPIIAAGNNEQVYIRVVTYSDTAFATAVDNGVVAASIVNQLTVTGRVQERLVFCVFALTDAAGSGTVGSGAGNLPTDCAASEAAASSSVDIGVIDNTTTAVSPVDNNPPTATGNDRFGTAVVNTNASNGVTLTYFAQLAGSGTNELRAFRVPGSTCNLSGTSLVDQCFISADDTTPETLTAGTERFGMYMACVENSSTSLVVGTTSNLGSGGSGAGTGGTFSSVYADGAANLAALQDSGSDCENEAGPYDIAWRDSGTAQALISSSTVVDDEMVKLRFGATAAATTPTGSYTVASTYIATPVF